MRLFLAIDFPAELRAALDEALAPLRAAAPGLRWVRPALVHLTVKFLDEQPPEVAERVATAIDEVAGRHRPMELVLEGIGAFPNFRRPRVAWIGVAPEPRLELLYHDVETACARLGFPVEGKLFRPHVTIARVRPGTTPDALRPLAAAARAVTWRGETVVETLDLMQSVLGPGGPRYEAVRRAPLRLD